MNSGRDPVPDAVDFETAGLFDATGFARGELLKPIFPHLAGADLREVLATVIDRHVLPKLDQKVQVMVIPSARNPVRARWVDGQEVVWNNAAAGTGPRITPPSVRVSTADIEECLAKAKRAVQPDDDLEIEETP